MGKGSGGSTASNLACVAADIALMGSSRVTFHFGCHAPGIPFWCAGLVLEERLWRPLDEFPADDKDAQGTRWSEADLSEAAAINPCRSLRLLIEPFPPLDE